MVSTFCAGRNHLGLIAPRSTVKFFETIHEPVDQVPLSNCRLCHRKQIKYFIAPVSSAACLQLAQCVALCGCITPTTGRKCPGGQDAIGLSLSQANIWDAIIESVFCECVTHAHRLRGEHV